MYDRNNINFKSFLNQKYFRNLKADIPLKLEEIIENNETKKQKIEKSLHINLDDTFLRLKNNNKKSKYRIRTILFHTGDDL